MVAQKIKSLSNMSIHPKVDKRNVNPFALKNAMQNPKSSLTKMENPISTEKCETITSGEFERNLLLKAKSSVEGLKNEVDGPFSGKNEVDMEKLVDRISKIMGKRFLCLENQND